MPKDKVSLNNFINYLSIGVIAVDKNCYVNLFNKEVLTILGLQEKKLANKKLSTLYNFNINKFIQDKVEYEVETIQFNNMDIIVEKRLIIVDGSVEGAYIFLQPLNTCKEFVKLLDENELEASFLLNTITEATNDAIVYVNKEGKIEILSKPYANFLGVNREEAIGKHVRDVIENTRMDIVVETGIAEIAQVQEINGRKMIATRIPVFINKKIVGAVGKVLFRDVDELNSLYKQINKIEKELNLYKDEFKRANKAKYALNSIISESRSMEELKELTMMASKTNSNILILGESGTGKELFAHAIHNNSKRKEAPFIKVNCAAIPYELLESELFGYEEGSFTGAKRWKNRKV